MQVPGLKTIFHISFLISHLASSPRLISSREGLKVEYELKTSAFTPVYGCDVKCECRSRCRSNVVDIWKMINGKWKMFGPQA